MGADFPPEEVAIGPGPKRLEPDPLDDEEKLLCDALTARLRSDGFEHIDRVLLLQMVRGYHYEEQRLVSQQQAGQRRASRDARQLRALAGPPALAPPRSDATSEDPWAAWAPASTQSQAHHEAT